MNYNDFTQSQKDYIQANLVNLMYKTDWNFEEQFTDEMDNLYDQVEIMGYKYFQCSALNRLDHVAWRQEYLAWLSEKEENSIISIPHKHSEWDVYYDQEDIQMLLDEHDELEEYDK